MQTLPFPAPARRRDPFDLVSALDSYEAATTRLVESWLDMEVYADFSRQIDAIRDHGVPDSSLTVLSLQLVIAHSELVSTLWQHASVGVPAQKMQEVQERHALAIDALRVAVASQRMGGGPPAALA